MFRSAVTPPRQEVHMGHNHQKTEHKTFSKPDEVREFPRGRVEVLKVGGGASNYAKP